jgi:carbon storage regulator CsrA
VTVFDVGLVDGKEESKGEAGSTDRHKEMPVLRTGIQTEGPNESDLLQEAVSREAIASGDVHRANRAPKQARSRLRGRLPVGGLGLRRKVNESVVLKTINGDIVVTLTEIAGGKAKLNFVAPPTVRIYREELLSKGVPA